MNNYTAYCGLDCGRCEARLATVNDDDALRRRVAALWSELNGVEITAESIHCSGCRIPTAIISARSARARGESSSRPAGPARKCIPAKSSARSPGTTRRLSAG